MAAKRVLEYGNLSLAHTPTKAAKLEGILTDLSPIKSGKYFDGRLADDTTSIRFVGFDAKKREQLAHHRDNGDAVSIEHCEIKKAKYSDDMEVIINNSTKFSMSPKKFNVSHSEVSTSDTSVPLGSIPQLHNFQTIIVIAKILSIGDPVEVKTGLTKQDLIISDSSGTAKLTVWQDDVDALSVGTCYIFNKVTVRTYDGLKYLTPPKAGWTYEMCDDIGIVADEPEDGVRDKHEVSNAIVAGVLYVTSHPFCISCKAKIDPLDDSIGKCTNCPVPLNSLQN